MELKDEEINKELRLTEKVTNKLSNELIIKVGTDEVGLQWEGIFMIILNPSLINYGSWATDREKNDPVLEFVTGQFLKENFYVTNVYRNTTLTLQWSLS